VDSPSGGVVAGCNQKQIGEARLGACHVCRQSNGFVADIAAPDAAFGLHCPGDGTDGQEWLPIAKEIQDTRVWTASLGQHWSSDLPWRPVRNPIG
jgi:hypothetical protein